MTRSRKIILTLTLIMVLTTLLVAGVLLFQRYMDMETYRDDIVASVKSALKRELSYERGEFSLGLVPSFSFTNVAIRERDGRTDFVRAERLTFKLAILPLLYKRVVLKEMLLERPVLRVVREKDGTSNVSDLFEEKREGSLLNVKGVQVAHGTVIVTDRAVATVPVVTAMEDAALTLSHLVRGKSSDFKLAGVLSAAGRKTPLALSGSVKLPAEGHPLTDTSLDGKIKTGPVDAIHFLPYYGRYLPFRRIAGQVSLDCTFRGKLATFKSKGEVRVSNLYLDYPQVFHAPLTPKLTRLDFEMELARDYLALENLKLNVDGAQGRGSCRLSDLHSGDLRITAKASTSALDFRQYHQFIPYGIIVKGPADFIEEKIRGGRYKLEEGRLDGKVSQITHMERGKNYEVLYVRARAEEGVLVYADNVPAFSQIRGILELSGKDFNLKGMSGRFGGSPFTLEGKIADYPLDTPSSYPFAMTMSPRQQEAAWLLNAGRAERLALMGDSVLKLKGAGFTSQYQLSGTWDLSAAGYSLSSLIAKPERRANTLSFAATLSPSETRVSSFSYQLPPLTLHGSALYRYDKGGGLSLEVRTNSFPAEEVAPLISELRKYRPAGMVQATLAASGPRLSELSWGGDLAFNGFSWNTGTKLKTVSAVGGTLHFNGTALETSHFTARLGGSQINGKGSLSGFKSPHLQCSFSAPTLDLADIGIAAASGPFKLEKVQGALTYGDGDLEISSMGAQFGRSTLHLKGSVADVDHPRIEVAVTSPYLELEDVLALSQLSASAGSGRSMPLKATVSAAEGRGRDIPFKGLKCTVMLEDRILYLQPLEFSSLDGEISARMRLDLGAGSASRYQISFSGRKLSAEKVMHALGVKKQQLTGTASLQGELTARGTSAPEIRRSALGTVKIRVEEGTVKRFAILSKVFSILNVSQLLKFQLPDMVSGGMPFNKITGDIAVKDGIASTSNLYLDSDAINMTTVGKLDLVREELDLTIGVQPLQTVDKIVSHIPVVGWILTGKDRTLVTTYFEAKGKVEDPKVSAVPVRSLAKGVLNVFKRMFELPARLITDVGQVIK